MACCDTGLLGEHTKDYLQIAQIVAIFCVGAVGAWIAYEQMTIANNKLKLDLYDRRKNIIGEISLFLKYIYEEGNMRDAVWAKFVLSTADAAYLFDKSIADYIDHLQRQGLRLQEINEEKRKEGNNRLGEERTKLMKWFDVQRDQLIDKFRPFMQIVASGETGSRARWRCLRKM